MAGDEEAPIQEHIIELLERLRRILIALIITSGIVVIIPAQLIEGKWNGYTPLVFYLMKRMQEDLTNVSNPIVKPIASFFGVKKLNVQLIAHSWLDSIEVILQLSLLLGLVIAAPYIAKQIYEYLEPALEEREKRVLIPFSLLFFFLFTIGVLYAYYVILPLTFFFLSWLYLLGGVELIFSVKEFYSFAIIGMLTTGLSFTFPLVVALLSYLDIISPDTLKKNWRYVVFIIMVVTAIITPDPTPVSMTALALPFLVLYVLSYLLAKKVHGRSGRPE